MAKLWTDRDDAELGKLHSKGLTPEQISRAMKRDFTTVHNRAVELNLITVDSPATETRKPRKPRNAEYQAAIDKRAAAVTIARREGKPLPPTVTRRPGSDEIVEAQRSKEEVQEESARKAEKAARMRIQRYDWTTIAKEVGYASRGAAHAAVKSHIENIPKEAVEDLRRMELESLDIAEAALKVDISMGDPQAIGAMLRVKEQRAKLTGLYDTKLDSVDQTLMRVQIATETARLIKAHPELNVDAIINEITKR